jgi:hypothetical protein
VRELFPDAHTAIVALTHDPKLDDMALLEALKSAAFYVGALGSRRNQETRKQRLAEHFDLSTEELARLHGPVGLGIGAKTPAEIAVSIVAEIVQVKNAMTPAVASAPGSPSRSLTLGKSDQLLQRPVMDAARLERVESLPGIVSRRAIAPGGAGKDLLVLDGAELAGKAGAAA